MRLNKSQKKTPSAALHAGGIREGLRKVSLGKHIDPHEACFVNTVSGQTFPGEAKFKVKQNSITKVITQLPQFLPDGRAGDTLVEQADLKEENMELADAS